MPNGKPSVAILSLQAPLISALERHLGRLGIRFVILRDFGELHRRIVSIRPAVVVLDERNTDEILTHIAKIRAHPVCAHTPILVLCAHADPQQIRAMHHAGSNDIMLISHHAPRDIAARVQTLLTL